MSASERQAWLALYAAAWFQPTGGAIGHVTDAKRAVWCATQATRGLQALRDLSVDVAEGRSELLHAAEVLE